MHRIRNHLVKQRTVLINQVRGLLTEYWIVMPKYINTVSKQLPSILEDGENELTDLGRELFADLYNQITELDKKIEEYEKRLNSIFAQSETCQRIAKLEGMGVLTATALIVTIGDSNVFKNGRHLAAFLGLIPRQHSSGNKQQLLGISK